MEKTYHFIYKTTNLLNDKYYYGMHSTYDLNDGYLGSGKRLRYSINKHGKENHVREIIEFLPNYNELIKREEEIVNLNEIAKENCLNLRVGGSGGLNGLSKESLMKIRIASSNYMKSLWKNGGEEYRNKFSKINTINLTNAHKNNKIKYDNFKNRKHRNETIELMKKKKIGFGRGSDNSQYNTCWVTRNGINKKIKKEKLSEFIKLGWINGRKFK